MKKSKNYLINALFIPLFFALLASGAFSCKDEKTVKYAPLRDYQIELSKDSIYLFDGERKVGAIPFGDSPIDSVIMNDNQ